MDRHVLQPAGLPDEAQHGLLGAQAPLLTVQGGRVPEDVGAAPLGDDLRREPPAICPACSPSSPGSPPPPLGVAPRMERGASPTAGSRPAAQSSGPSVPVRGNRPGRPAAHRQPAESRPPPGGHTGTAAPAPSGGSSTGAWPSCRWWASGLGSAVPLQPAASHPASHHPPPATPRLVAPGPQDPQGPKAGEVQVDVLPPPCC